MGVNKAGGGEGHACTRQRYTSFNIHRQERSVRKQLERGQFDWFPQMRGSMVGDKAGGEGRTQVVWN